MKHRWPVKCLEMDAIGECLKSVIDRISRPYPKIIVESDSAKAIAILNRSSEDWSEVWSPAEEVLHMAKIVGSIEFTFKPRESNGVAHSLERCASTGCF